MRAAVLYGKEDIRIEEVPTPPLRPGEVRVAIGAALTCGTDLKVFRRGYHAKMIVPPAVFGHELAGTVAEVHPETTGWKVGKRVVVANSAPCGECFMCHHGQENLCDDLLFLNGAYAESVTVPARIVEKNMLRLKPGTAFADAALTEPLACVVQGVADLALRGGQRLLVIGSGPIGLMFVALFAHFGCDVTLAGRGEERLALARRLGAAIIETKRDHELIPTVKAVGRTYDAVIEAVGKPETWEAAIQLVRKGGAVNLFGGCPSGTSVRLDTGLIHYSNLKLLASFHHTPAAIRQALALIEQGVINARDFVNGDCTLDQLPALFRSMAAGNRAVKTLVVTPKP
ncbi:MAG TPA: alcohol dehydrogenase catalytic domain-containing protein [Verrucomicrobiae bacterium]|nr:alcohol dehydrogenase catalytic domain-containing protein [Verrucomicrobiae bacterium]